MFTDGEIKALQFLVLSNNIMQGEFKERPQHPMEVLEWTLAMHRLQDLIAARLAQRQHPEIFNLKKA